MDKLHFFLRGLTVSALVSVLGKTCFLIRNKAVRALFTLIKKTKISVPARTQPTLSRLMCKTKISVRSGAVHSLSPAISKTYFLTRGKVALPPFSVMRKSYFLTWTKAVLLLIIPVIILSAFFSSCNDNNNQYRKISVEEYRDKMKAAWVGQMAGVGWGLPTEFDYTDQIIPEEEVPEWTGEMVNQQGNDDLYVEMTFLGSMDRHGIDVSIRQAGIDFANTGYTLWAANKEGRENLRFGIAPPESSHPFYSDNCDDIDYQIEADYSGIIAPGMPGMAVSLGEKFGRLMNYGDGMYGGQFVGGMYAAAYFENDIKKIIEAGLAAIPGESHYATCVRDVVAWHAEHPGDWKTTWQLIEEKYHKSTEYQQFAEKEGAWIPIDAKLNGAYIVMGLLYGNGDMDSTIVISMRGGKDSDCNPSNAAGVLATTIGYEKLPSKYKSDLDMDRNFSYSEYNLTGLLALCEKFTREYIVRNGGKIETGPGGKEYFYIPRREPGSSPFRPSYDPGPYDPDNRYSPEEMKNIKAWSIHHFEPVFEELEVDMEVRHCGKLVSPGLVEWNGRKKVLPTAPMSADRGLRMILQDTDEIPQGRKGYFMFSAGHDPDAEWKLMVRKGRRTVIDTLVSVEYSRNGWMDFEVDISEFAGSGSVDLQFQAEQAGHNPAVNYWSDFRIRVE